MTEKMHNSKIPMIPKISIVSFSSIRKDGRVLRQINWLKEFAELQIVGFDPMPVESVVSNAGHPIHWVELPRHRYNTRPCAHQERERINKLGPFLPALYKEYYKTIRAWQLARFNVLAFEPNLVISNELDPLPIAVEAKRTWKNVRILLDMHEFSPEQYGKDNRNFYHIDRPRYVWLLKTYGQDVDQVTTVSDHFPKILRKRYKLKSPKVIYNAPDLPLRRRTKLSESDGKIHVVHHGGATLIRNQGVLIESVRRCKHDIKLHFFLVGKEESVEELKAQAADISDKVEFHNPVPSHQIAERISEYDLGAHAMPDYSLNAAWAMPNKMFEFAAAGLPILVGPSPGMGHWVNKFDCGWIADGYDTEAITKMLDGLSRDEILLKHAGALKMSQAANAQTERKKFLYVVGKALQSKLFFAPRDEVN